MIFNISIRYWYSTLVYNSNICRKYLHSLPGVAADDFELAEGGQVGHADRVHHEVALRQHRRVVIGSGGAIGNIGEY